MTDTNGRSRGAERLDAFVANPRRALWTLAVPILFGMSVQTIYVVVDMIFVGRLSAEALTALAFNMPPAFLAMGITFGMGSAVTALIAQAVGRRDEEAASTIADHTVVIALIMTVVFTTVGLVWGRWLLAVLGVPAELMEPAWQYFQISAGGYAFMAFSTFFRSIMSGEGEVRAPVIIQMVATLLNIALDPLLIFTFGMGIRGAAIATVTAQALATLAFVYLLFVRRGSAVRFNFSDFRPKTETFATIFRIGVPASLSFLVMALGAGSFNRLLVEFSPDAVAAQQIGGRIDQVVILPLVAISAGLVTLVGMFYGARRTDLLVAIIRYAITRAMIIGTVGAVLFSATAPWIVAVFTDSPEIRGYAIRYVRIISLAYPFFGVSMLTGRVLQGLGRGTPELVLSLLRVVLIALPLAWFFGFVLHKPAHYVWIAMLISSWTSAAVAAIWLRSAIRKAVEEPPALETAELPQPTIAS